MLRSIGVFATVLGVMFAVLGLVRISGLLVSLSVADQLGEYGFWEYFTATGAFLAIGALSFGCEHISAAVRSSGGRRGD